MDLDSTLSKEPTFLPFLPASHFRKLFQHKNKRAVVHTVSQTITFIRRHHHHHHIPEGLSVFPVPWSSRRSWSLHLFLGRPMFLRPFGFYCSACFGSLFVSDLCTCCSHVFWYYFISFTMFCAPFIYLFFCLIHWFFSLSRFVIPSQFLKNFICAASKRCSTDEFFETLTWNKTQKNNLY